MDNYIKLLDSQTEYITFTREKPKANWLPFSNVQNRSALADGLKFGTDPLMVSFVAHEHVTVIIHYASLQCIDVIVNSGAPIGLFPNVLCYSIHPILTYS
ncbi:hypothetical protein KIN20_004245 [Parelaphostrongylus tenuis]|uniref:Uncharacterized protein n=1 Tax=Parelaphostrongylus tenuis TaxID=148309 RepID=A0AAD5QF03_PARTN|nr:hypothetical protein KIN20_004245 [Parelaphostrongylus tenuis]